MEIINKIKNFKKIIIRFAMIFFVVMLVLLFFSKTVETMLLPAVTVFKPQDKTISDSYNLKASVNYESTKKVYPMFKYFVSQVLIESEQEVITGQPIAKLREIDVDKVRSEFEQEIFLLETNIYQIEKPLRRWMNKEDKAQTEKQLEMTKKALEEKQDDMELYFSIIDDDYNLLSDFNGTVTKVIASDQSYIDITAPMLEYVDDTIGSVISWDMPKSKKEKYDDTSRLYIEYSYKEQDDEGKVSRKSDTQKLPIDKIEYNSETEMYTYQVMLDNEKHKNIISSSEMGLRLVTQPINVKDAIPASAVFDDPNSMSRKIIYVISEDHITKEIRVKQVSVTILQENDMYVQVAYQFSYDEEVVLTTTKALSHNMKVKLR